MAANGTPSFNREAARQLGVTIGTTCRQTCERFGLGVADITWVLLSATIGFAQQAGLRRSDVVNRLCEMWPQIDRRAKI